MSKEAKLAPLADPDRLRAYKEALGNWKFTGYIQFVLNEQAYEWIRSELDDVALRDVARLMCEHVMAGGEIDEVAETRPEWRGRFEYHYDLRFEINETPVYIETRLNYRLPVVTDESWILVVNVHGP